MPSKKAALRKDSACKDPRRSRSFCVPRLLLQDQGPVAPALLKVPETLKPEVAVQAIHSAMCRLAYDYVPRASPNYSETGNLHPKS